MEKTFKLGRDCPATAIPAGEATVLPAGSDVFVVQALGGHVTVRGAGGLFRIAGSDAGAIDGYEGAAAGGGPPEEHRGAGGAFSEEAVWSALKTCFDPEIPVNIVDLGLVYDLSVSAGPKGGNAVEVKMTLTAPGCGMGPMIAEDARGKIAALDGVESARVHIVWDPVWTPQMISQEGRKILGLE